MHANYPDTALPFLQSQQRCWPLLLALLLPLLWQNTQASVNDAADPQLRRILRQAIRDSNSFADHFSAEVWLLDMSTRLKQRLPNHLERISLLKLVHQEARRAGLPAELVLAVIDVESNFDRWAISSAGAQGLMQVMPFWLQEIGRPDDNLHKPRTNLRLGCTILRYYLDLEKGDLSRALARYNGSRGKTTYSRRVLEVLSRRWYRR